MRLLALPVAALVLLSGCAAAPEAAEATPPAAAPEPAEETPSEPAPDPVAREPTTVAGATPAGHRYETTSWQDTIDLTLPYGVPFAPYDQQDPESLFVAANVTAVLLEVAWDDTTMDLNAYIIPGHCADLPGDLECDAGLTTRTSHWHEARGGGPGAGDSPSRLLLTADTLMAEPCLPCEWTFGAHTETAAARVVAEVHVTLFYGFVPDGFTALG